MFSDIFILLHKTMEEDISIEEEENTINEIDTLSGDVSEEVFEEVSDEILEFEKLPKDILQLLISKLDDEHLAVMCMIDKNFNKRICNNDFWLNKIRQRFGLSKEYIDLSRNKNTYWAYYNYLARPLEEYRKEKAKQRTINYYKSLEKNLARLYEKLENTKGETMEHEFLVRRLRKIKLKLEKRAYIGIHSSDEPKLISEKMLEFIKNANFGSFTPLIQILNLTKGVGSEGLLSKLLFVYANVNDLIHYSGNVQKLRFSEELYKYLGIGDINTLALFKVAKLNVEEKVEYDERFLYLDGVILNNIRKKYKR